MIRHNTSPRCTGPRRMACSDRPVACLDALRRAAFHDHHDERSGQHEAESADGRTSAAATGPQARCLTDPR